MNKLLAKQLGNDYTEKWMDLMQKEKLPEKPDAYLENGLKNIRKELEKKLLDAVEGRITENVMDVVLSLMSVLFVLDKNYRKNIHNFEAVYVFTDQNDDFYVAARFHKDRLTIQNKKVDNPNFILRFRDNEALVKLLFSGAPDILNAMLNQQVDFEGNVNYINKFAYMALHILLSITGGQGFADA